MSLTIIILTILIRFQRKFLLWLIDQNANLRSTCSLKILLSVTALHNYATFKQILCKTILGHNCLFLYHPSPRKKKLGGGVDIGITPSICPFVRSCPFDISWTAQPFFTKLGMALYHHEVMCLVQKLFHYLQCQGHSKGLCNKNMPFFFFTLSSKRLVRLQPNLIW